MMKKGSFVKITGGNYKGQKGTVIGRTKEGDVIVSIDLDGDPLTPPIEVKVPARFAKAMRIINMLISVLLPLLYGVFRK